ncbi:epimerase, partial [Planctomycetota bacterium]
PEALFPLVNGRPGFPTLAPGVVNHIKLPIVVSDEAFRQATGFRHIFEEVQIMEAYRQELLG